jgi:hypothetical protein
MFIGFETEYKLLKFMEEIQEEDYDLVDENILSQRTGTLKENVGVQNANSKTSIKISEEYDEENQLIS